MHFSNSRDKNENEEIRKLTVLLKIILVFKNNKQLLINKKPLDIEIGFLKILKNTEYFKEENKGIVKEIIENFVVQNNIIKYIDQINGKNIIQFSEFLLKEINQVNIKISKQLEKYTLLSKDILEKDKEINKKIASTNSSVKNPNYLGTELDNKA